ncbi:hypothetical protein DACRYDRAFT_113397 [Dacryopinax primogenitus]|uniref:P-loop containing nucleoside triphosphate hydrolase protein n=1 Tax=Dacryopinax primogenitus (strain DJM 731) TaxID=1858805 RepID=M5GGB9_DACPD|nr:uncharacterized protein DACRYDRAFT_113397 [Dacryopinax primogenitus]EJU05218.1 hypothetical protein DACRYDRAFT_113397 [Dacryopinax primogenitus]
MVQLFPRPFKGIITGDKPDPSVTEVQILGAGVGRTGTTSLHQALVTLGFGPCHHGFSLHTYPQQSIAYLRTIGKPNADYGALLRGYRSAIDLPDCFLLPEMMAAFPKAKVILTVRDSPEVWLKSWNNTLARMATVHFFLLVLPLRSVRLATLVVLTVGKFRYPNVPPKDLFNAEAYKKHNDWVRSIVPKEKLLEFNVKEGWEPLCKFLEVEVPDVPFPRTNDTAFINKQINDTMVLGLMTWTVILAGIAGSAYCMWTEQWRWPLELVRDNILHLHDIL